MSGSAGSLGAIRRLDNSSGWEGYLSLGVDPVTGRRRRTKVRATTKAAVQAKLDRLIALHAARRGAAQRRLDGIGDEAQS